MTRIAVIGAGYWGPNLIRNLDDLDALAVVCDLSAERLAAVREQHGVRTTASFDEILAEPTIDAIAVATPVPTHFPLARKALLAGKHVFVEKPLALSGAEADALVDLADERRRVLMVGHLLEYHPAFTAIKELMASGDLGTIRHIRCSRLNFGKLRMEENVLWSFAPHDLSLILRLAGEEPRRVDARGYRILGTPREDAVHVDLEFPSGLSAHVHVSWLEPEKLHQFVVIGSRRMVVFNDVLKTEKVKVYDKGFDPDDGEFVARNEGYRALELGPGEPMKLELLDFLEACQTGRPPLTDGASGARVVKVLERAGQVMAAERMTA